MDRAVAATSMKLDEIARMIVAKGIAALMKDRGITSSTWRRTHEANR